MSARLAAPALVLAIFAGSLLSGCGGEASDDANRGPASSVSESAAASLDAVSSDGPGVVSTEKHCSPADYDGHPGPAAAVFGKTTVARGICRAVDIGWNYGFTDLLPRRISDLDAEDFTFAETILTDTAAKSYRAAVRRSLKAGVPRGSRFAGAFGLVGHGLYSDIDGEVYEIATDVNYLTQPTTRVISVDTWRDEKDGLDRLSVRFLMTTDLAMTWRDRFGYAQLRKELTLYMLPPRAKNGTWLVDGWNVDWTLNKWKRHKGEPRA